MTSEAKKGGLPTWAKILIGLVVVGTIGVVAFLVGIVLFFGNMSKQATDPAYISRVVKSVAVVQDPLPQGFQYQMAIEIMGANMFIVNHKPDNLQLIMGMMPPSDKKEDSAESMTQELSRKGIPNVGTSFEVTGKGVETVAGEQMPYVLGTTQDKTGQKIEGLIGAILTKDHKKAILFYGISQKSPYNMDATKEFLGVIKSF